MSVPHLQQLITVQMTGNRRIATQIRQMNQNFERLGRTTERISNQIQRSMARQRRATQRTAQQTRTGLTNIQSGLVQLSTWLLNVNVKINNVFANMKTRFTEAETAMTQLKITMGLSGKTAVDSSVDFQRFAEASSQIDLLARTTQFTKREVANAFTALVQSGRTVGEASKMISSTLQFATASGGMLNLTDSVDLATLTIGTLGGAVDEVDGNLNMLLKTSQKTKIGFTDLRQVLQSMRAAYTKFSEVGGVSREAELMATAAALRTLGLSAGNSGQVIDQFSRSMDTMYSTLNKVFMMENQPNRKGGRRPRFSYKRGALAELFGVGRLSVQELQKQLNTTETDLRKLQDRFLMSQIFEYDKTGTRGSRRSLSDFITRLLKGYSDVVKRKGEGPADSLIKNAIGTAGASTLIKSIISLAKTAGKSIDEAAEHYIGLVKELQTNSKEMMKADEEAKQTIAYRTKVLDSAIAALSNTIFEQDIVAISALDTYKEMVSATGTLFDNNKGLASSVSLLGRGFQALTGIGTNVGFALVAAATFSTALTFSLNGATVAATGLGATLGAFSRVFLLPTLTIVGQLTLALGGLGLAVVALVNYFSDGMGVAKGFKVMLDNIKFAAMSAGGMMNLVFSKDFGSRNVKTLVKDYYKASDAMASIERQLDQLYNKPGGNLTKQERESVYQLTQEYDRLGAKMSKIKGVLGESGYVGLDALGARGASNMAVTFAGLVQLAKELFTAIKVVTEGALIPLTYAMDLVVFIASTIGTTLLLPFRALAAVLGFASDEAGAIHFALKAVGFALGALLGYRMVLFMFNSLGFALGALLGRFTQLRNGVTNYTTTSIQNLGAVNTAVQQGSATFGRQIGVLERLRMVFAAVSGSQERFVNTQRRFTQGTLTLNNALNAQRTRLQAIGTAARGYFTSIGRGFMAISGAAATFGGMMMMSSNESTAAMGQTIMMMSTLAGVIVSLATTFIPMLVTAFRVLNTMSLGMAFSTIGLVVGALVLLAYAAKALFDYFSEQKKKSYFEEDSATQVGRSFVSASGEGMASFSSVTPATSGVGQSTMGTAQFQRVSSASPKTVIKEQDNRTTVNIEQVTIKTTGTADGLRTGILKVADNRPQTKGPTSFASQGL